MLLILALVSGKPGTEIGNTNVRPSDAWALDVEELGIYVRWLVDKGFLSVNKSIAHYHLTLDGWIEVDRLKHQRVGSGTRCFVAMSLECRGIRADQTTALEGRSRSVVLPFLYGSPPYENDGVALSDLI